MDETKQINGLSALVHYGNGEPYLIGGKCMSCKAIFFPKQSICPRCTGQQIEETPPLSRRGKLYTYTAVHQKPPDYEGTVPYIVGQVRLPEGVFVLAQIKAAIEDLTVNMDMELVVEAIFSDPTGNVHTGYKFQPVRSGPETD